MYLAEISDLPTFSNKPLIRKKFDLVARCFDESLLRRLKALDPPSISLSWIAQAFDFLSFTHAEARNLISNLELSDDDDDDLLDRYLVDSVKILDLCNSVSSQIERFRRGRLLVNFFLQTVNSSETPSPEKLRRARDSLSGVWESSSLRTRKHNFNTSLEDHSDEKVSSVGRLIRRTIHAVQLITVFVAGVVFSSLYGSPSRETTRAPAKFSWSETVNDLDSAFSTELSRKKRKATFKEWDDVKARSRAVFEVIDDVDAGNKKERINGAVKELRTATEALTKGVDGLVDGVNGTFNTVLCIRNDMLANMRLGQDDKQPPKAKRHA